MGSYSNTDATSLELECGWRVHTAHGPCLGPRPLAREPCLGQQGPQQRFPCLALHQVSPERMFFQTQIPGSQPSELWLRRPEKGPGDGTLYTSRAATPAAWEPGWAPHSCPRHTQESCEKYAWGQNSHRPPAGSGISSQTFIPSPVR